MVKIYLVLANFSTFSKKTLSRVLFVGPPQTFHSGPPLDTDIPDIQRCTTDNSLYRAILQLWKRKTHAPPINALLSQQHTKLQGGAYDENTSHAPLFWSAQEPSSAKTHNVKTALETMISHRLAHRKRTLPQSFCSEFQAQTMISGFARQNAPKRGTCSFIKLDELIKLTSQVIYARSPCCCSRSVPLLGKVPTVADTDQLITVYLLRRKPIH